MRHFARIFTSISAGFDTLVGQIENHEAIAESTLKQLRLDIRDAKVQYKIMEKEIQQAAVKQKRAESDIGLWENRARKYSETDRDKALHCVQRMKQCQADAEFWRNKELELKETSENLKVQLQRIEAQYQDLRTKLQTLSSREKSAKLCTQSQQAVNDINSGDLGDVFQRWEKTVLKKEMENSFDLDNYDSVSAEIDREEEQIDLESALDELLTKDQ